MALWPTLWRVFCVAIALAVPLAVYLINGVVEPWAFVLGAVIGFAVWYFGLPTI